MIARAAVAFLCLYLTATSFAQVIVVDTDLDLPVDTCDDPVVCTGNNNNIANDYGDLPGRDGKITFREALLAAQRTNGVQTIRFSTPSNSHTVLQHGPLPPYVDSGGGIIAAKHTFRGNVVSAASPNSVVHGLVVTGSDNVIDGLVFNDFRNVFPARRAGSSGLVISGNNNTVRNVVSGTDAGGSVDIPNGIGITVRGAGNSIGPENTFSGNLWQGVGLVGNGNRLHGNWIGDSAISRDLGNAFSGVAIWGSRNLVGAASFTRIGGRVITTGDGNSIVANSTASTPNGQYGGVHILGGDGNTIVNNRIGVDVTANRARGNLGVGVMIIGGNRNTVIQNTVSGNKYEGIRLRGARNNSIENNKVGTNGAGDRIIANESDGLSLYQGSNDNRVIDNVISGNLHNGVELRNSDNNEVRGNRVGLNLDADAILKNEHSGIYLSAGASNNQIGFDGPIGGFFGYTFFSRSRANFISGNGRSGVYIGGPGSNENQIMGNRIGTDKNGNVDLGNGYNGIQVRGGARENTIKGNTISGNGHHGVRLRGADTDENILIENIIGLDGAGDVVMGNERTGVYISGGAKGNKLGSLNPDSGNVISGNGTQSDHSGVVIDASENTQLTANTIGLNKDRTQSRPNMGSGVHIRNGSHNTEIGNFAVASRNYVSGNSEHGVHVADANNLSVLYAVIGLDKNANDKGNVKNGIFVEGNSEQNKLGRFRGGNVISGNDEHGIFLSGAAVKQTTIRENTVGLDPRRQIRRGNGRSGIRIEQADTVTVNGGNEIGAHAEDGIYIGGAAKTVNIFENFIGLNSHGMAFGNGGNGVRVTGGATSVVVGALRGGGNTIGSNTGDGIRVDGTTTQRVTISSNSIGIARNSLIRPNAIGVNLEDGAQWVRIGGKLQGEGNTIAYNTGHGVRVAGAATDNNRIQRNSIYKNGGQGIELASTAGIDGIDAGDADTGANEGMNRPVLCIARDNSGGRVYLGGHLEHPAANTAEIEVFLNNPVEANGFGEGQHYVGSLTVGTGGRIYIPDILLNFLVLRRGLTATATVGNNTSEFSPILDVDVSSTAAANVVERRGNRDLNHWVAARNLTVPGPPVDLSLTVSPSTPEVRSRLSWQNAAAAAGNPLAATVNRDAPGEHAVKVLFDGHDCIESRVWIVWATMAGQNTTRLPGGAASPSGTQPVAVQTVTTPTQSSAGRGIESSWVHSASIQPASIITATDRPHFDYTPVTTPHSYAHFNDGVNLSRPPKRWDITRQVRSRILAPTTGTNRFSDVPGVTYDNLPNANRIIATSPNPGANGYPADNVEGNDDPRPGSKDTNPYDNIPAGTRGRLYSNDTVRLPLIINQGGTNGELVEIRAQFREFARLEINGTWYRISDNYLWRHHGRVQHDGTVWQDAGSVSDGTNAGW